MKTILLIITGAVEIGMLVRWFSCWHFQEIFLFTKPILMDRLLNSTNNDMGIPLLLTRMLHNKITYLFWGGAQTFLQYWDIRFLKEFIGLIGAIGVLLALWYLFTKKRRVWYLWLLVGIYSIFACIELFISPNLPFLWKIIGFAIPLQILSLFGIWYFLSKKSTGRYIFVIVLLILSLISLLLFPLSYQLFCIKV